MTDTSKRPEALPPAYFIRSAKKRKKTKKSIWEQINFFPDARKAS
jgi:hypothetical protein